MKKKYKLRIIFTCLVVSGIWGLLGTWLVLKNPDHKLITELISYALYMICLIIPVRMIAKKARTDLNPS
jgi:hypothetical protein